MARLKLCQLVLLLYVSFFRFAIGDNRNTLFFRVTYRDFLPAGCYIEYGNQTLSDYFYDIWGKNADPGSLSNPGGYVGNIGGAQASACEGMNPNYQAYLNAGKISGHPDFNVGGNIFTTYSNVCPSNNFPIGSCIGIYTGNDAYKNEDVSIINQTLVINHAGIPKPEYCSSEPGARCGRMYMNGGETGGYSQTTKKYFDMWYNDNKVYNKRIGQLLRLYETLPNSKSYLYDSNNANNNDGNEQFQFVSVDPHPVFFGPIDRFKDDRTSYWVNQDDYPNPYDSPAWQQYNIPAIENKYKSYSVSTEIHATFVYNRSESMLFEFSGDDDFWAFINGQMVIDLGGLHGAVQKTVDLNAQVGGIYVYDRLNLTDGEVYDLDVFHAERNYRDSNFKVSTTLFPACNVIQSGSTSFDIGESIANSTLDEVFYRSSLITVNDAEGSINISDAGNKYSSGFIFHKVKDTVGRGFVSKFSVNVDGNTDGFAFVIQNAGLSNYPISGTPYFNFKGVKNSIAVVFDLCSSRDNICDEKEVRIHYPDSGNTPNIANIFTRRVYDPIEQNLQNRNFEVEIIYYGGKPDYLEVYIDNSLYLRQRNLPILDILGGSLGGYVGITSTTSNVASNIKIKDWSLSTVEVDPTKTEITSTNLTNIVVADGLNESAGITIQTFDGCNNKIDSGSLGGFVSAIYVEKLNDGSATYADGSFRPAIISGKVNDNEDGSYTVGLVTNVVANFSFYVTFGEDCYLDYDTFPSVNLTQALDLSVTVSSSGSCYTCDGEVCSISDAAESTPYFPPTPAPTPLLGSEDDNSELVLVAATSGGVLGFLMLIAAVFFVVYRQRWLRDNKYIADGEAYILETNTNFSGGDEFSRMTAQVVNTQAQINRKRAEAAVDPRSKAIRTLEDENADMKETIRMKKKVAQANMQQAQNPKYKKKIRGKVEM